MKQTNFQLFDFLDFDTCLTGEERLWISCSPVSAWVDSGDVVFDIPFQKQKVTNDISPDRESSRKNFQLRMGACGLKILRVSIGFGFEVISDS